MEVQRRELAAFLRSRRERLSPEAAGITPTRGRRRTPGLRREEVAQLAGVSPSWYMWLEQARRIRVSEQVLRGIGAALRLDETETAHMLRLAGALIPGPRKPCAREQIPGEYLAFLGAQEPNPAFIANRRLDLLAWTAGFAVLVPYLETLEPERRNVLDLTFDPRARELLPEWERDASHTLALFRAQIADRVTEPPYTELIERLRREHPAFCALWERRDLATAAPPIRTFSHPEAGQLALARVTLRLPDVEATLVAHQPPPGTTLPSRFLELVAGHPAT
ncbi:helix-turn-helix transcriptional regulator [Streptomyces sp. NPDC050560]|uniref:helix-turn-helix transcriptional regulator n=1 Tax=Streptomyces sp. NPDC050560 TaxID=3365630 RepID=UPI003792493F